MQIHRALAKTSEKGTRANIGRNTEDCSIAGSQTQAKQIEGDAGASVSAVKEDNKSEGNGTSDQMSLKCCKCGKSGHFVCDKHCLARSKTCAKCHMTGHFASVCRTKSKQEQKEKNKCKRGGHKKVNGVEDGEDDEYASTVGFGKSWDRSGSEMVNLQVGGVNLSGVLIDSGSSFSLRDKIIIDSPDFPFQGAELQP